MVMETGVLYAQLRSKQSRVHYVLLYYFVLIAGWRCLSIAQFMSLDAAAKTRNIIYT